MKKNRIFNLIVVCILFLITNLNAQIGYYDAPYTRYEADLGNLNNASITSKSYIQTDLQSEASNQVCVNLSNPGSSVHWLLTKDGDGLVVRYSIPDGQTGIIEVYADNVFVGTLNLSTYYSWEYLASNGNPNNVGVVNTNPRMRFDEVRMKLPSKILAGGELKLVRQTGNIYLDFVEMELIPSAVMSSIGDIIYTGDGSDLQTFIDANGGASIYIPEGSYSVNNELYFGVANTSLKGAGIWYSQLHFINNVQGGLRANALDISYRGLYLTTVRNSRSNSYKAINGVYTSGSVIENIWAEHFECGAWIAQYNSGSILFSDGFLMSNCRFRNNYSDGINLCKGTSNSIVEHCSFRNNGDDDMAIWSANGMECQNNTFRFNTSENCWRAAGYAVYGGYNNKGHHLLIKDNLEAGLRINNNFSGAGFNDKGGHEFSDISIIGCGTFNDLFNSPVGAIDIGCNNIAGTRIKNIKFSNITITDSKNDAIYINKKNGEGFYNLVFENISIDGTGKEFPGNNVRGLTWGRGYGILFVGYPSGFGSYCNMTYSNRGGNAIVDVNASQIGAFKWTKAGCGTYLSSPLTGAVFGECDPFITIASEASSDNGIVDSVAFFVDGAKVGIDLSYPYSFDWNNVVLGVHQFYTTSYHGGSGTTIHSPVQEISIVYFKGLLSTATAPIIDGVAESLWSSYTSASLEKISIGSVSSKEDLSATFQVNYDENNLYLLVDITDDDLRNDGGNNWDNDAVEVFIDIGNDKKGSYGSDDYSFNFVYNNPIVYETKHNATGGVIFSQGAKTGGYILEISIPWNTLGLAAAIDPGDLLGFDVHVNDDDGGGTRDSKKTWNDCSDIAWNTPYAFGTLQESGCTSSSEPLGFIYFQTTQLNGNAILNWQAFYQSNISSFEVQRDVSGSGNFQTVGNVNSLGSPGILFRSYTNYNVPVGTISYHVNQVDVRGCKIMSDNLELNILTDIRTKNKIGETDFEFYPNPFLNTGTLCIHSGNSNHYTFLIKDANGKLVDQGDVLGGAVNSIGDRLTSGMYVLEILEGNTRQFVKLIKL